MVSNFTFLYPSLCPLCSSGIAFWSSLTHAKGTPASGFSCFLSLLMPIWLTHKNIAQTSVGPLTIRFKCFGASNPALVSTPNSCEWFTHSVINLYKICVPHENRNSTQVGFMHYISQAHRMSLIINIFWINWKEKKKQLQSNILYKCCCKIQQRSGKLSSVAHKNDCTPWENGSYSWHVQIIQYTKVKYSANTVDACIHMETWELLKLF
jgi:hypothetical protein